MGLPKDSNGMKASTVDDGQRAPTWLMQVKGDGGDGARWDRVRAGLTWSNHRVG